MVRNVSRRKVLASSVTAAITLTSGCAGYTVKETEEMQQLKSDLQSKDRKISSLEKNLNQSQSEIDSLNQTLSKRNSEISELDENVHTQKAKKVLYLYANGIAEYSVGDSNWSNASSSYQNEDYADAAYRLGAAYGHYNSANKTFSTAKSRAKEFGFDGVISDIEKAVNKSASSATAANEYGQACVHYARGENDAGDTDYNDGNTAYQESKGYSVVNLDKLENTLGVKTDI